MDEFKREYEYEEETGVSGFLLIFLLTLISFDLVAAIILFSQSSMIIREFSNFVMPYMGLWAIYGIVKLVFCVSLFMKRKAVVAFARGFLIARLGLFSLTTLTTYILIMMNSSVASINLVETNTPWEITYRLFIAPLIYIIGFSVGWIYYFKRSKRVKNFYKLNDDTGATVIRPASE